MNEKIAKPDERPLMTIADALAVLTRVHLDDNLGADWAVQMSAPPLGSWRATDTEYVQAWDAVRRFVLASREPGSSQSAMAALNVLGRPWSPVAVNLGEFVNAFHTVQAALAATLDRPAPAREVDFATELRALVARHGGVTEGYGEKAIVSRHIMRTLNDFVTGQRHLDPVSGPQSPAPKGFHRIDGHERYKPEDQHAASVDATVRRFVNRARGSVPPATGSLALEVMAKAAADAAMARTGLLCIAWAALPEHSREDWRGYIREALRKIKEIYKPNDPIGLHFAASVQIVVDEVLR